MIFNKTALDGVFILQLEAKADERGFFARTWCEEEYRQMGLNAKLAQCSLSTNSKKGTLRGMHYQAAPHAEAKSVRCSRGAIFDVVLDMRPQSPTFRHWLGVELTAANHDTIYIPEGCAHGFLTLDDDTEVIYMISEFHRPECARGVRWNDPVFQIGWPSQPVVMSDRDRDYPDFA